MKKIIHSYGVESDWVQPFATKHGGVVEGNFIKVPDHLITGPRYFLNCSFGISAFYVDVVYHSDIHLRQEHATDDFVAIYYNLTEGDATVTLDGSKNQVGKWNNNLAIIDSVLKSDYVVKAGSQKYELCIFVKKRLIKKYFKIHPALKNHADEILNPKRNTIVKFTRMSDESYQLLMDLRAIPVGGQSFDLQLKGAVQCLLADFVEKMTMKEIVIDKISDFELQEILKSQAYLIENIDKTFPDIELLAKQAHMPIAKYQKLFKKTIGLSPRNFFLNHKLLEAKRLLNNRELTITEIAVSLSFESKLSFAAKFKRLFGMSPKTYISQMP